MGKLYVFIVTIDSVTSLHPMYMQVGGGGGGGGGTLSQKTLREFSYTPRGGHVDQLRPHTSSSSTCLQPDVDFFQQRNRLVEDIAATGRQGQINLVGGPTPNPVWYGMVWYGKCRFI